MTKKSILLALFLTLFCSLREARADIYGLVVIAENPELNLMQGGALMAIDYESAFWTDIYIYSELDEGEVKRSEGESYGGDCYPTINGVCAVVNTQNVIDFLNPDPHVIYMDMFMIMYFYIEPSPGVFAWANPMGYSLAETGGNAEWTWPACWCGGYVSSQVIYLGTLGIYFPKPPVEYFIGGLEDDMILAAQSNLPKTNAQEVQLSFNLVPVMIGERYQLRFVGVRNRPNSFVFWNIGGKYVESWDVTCGNLKNPIQCGSPTFTTGSTISVNTARTNPILMWYEGSPLGLPFRVSPVFIVYGRRYEPSPGGVQVFSPNVNVTASYENAVDVRSDYLSDDPNSRIFIPASESQGEMPLPARPAFVSICNRNPFPPVSRKGLINGCRWSKMESSRREMVIRAMRIGRSPSKGSIPHILMLLSIRSTRAASGSPPTRPASCGIWMRWEDCSITGKIMRSPSRCISCIFRRRGLLRRAEDGCR